MWIFGWRTERIICLNSRVPTIALKPPLSDSFSFFENMDFVVKFADDF